MSKIEFHILGSTALRREDGEFDQSFLAGPKRLAVLIYLILARPHGFQRRDKLIALFWPELGQKSARNALSNMLYHIRDVMGKDMVLSRGTEEIRINPEKYWCDAVAFENALDEGDEQKAMDLYHGELLPGFHVTDISNEFQNWLDGERERLRLGAADGAWALAGQAEEAGNLALARECAKKAVSYTALSEEPYRRLIELLCRTGDRSGALEVYQEFAERLQQEWNMDPSDKLKRLVEEIDEYTGTGFDSHPDSNKSRSPNSAIDKPHETNVNTQQTVSEKSESEHANDDGETRSKNVWWVAAGLLITIITAGWIFWSGNSTSDGIPPVTARSVAVLPFTYLGAEDSTDYFSLGMTEEILSRLGQVSDLSVISRTSAMQYRNTEKSLREIGEELGVAAVVEGSVQQIGDSVRIYAQLIDAETDHHLWSESYDGELKNIFAVQSDIAKAIAGELKAELASGVRERIERAPTKDLAAYELFLRGREYHHRTIKEENKTSIDLLQRAIERDRDFALARATLAKAYAKDTWLFGANSHQSDSAVAEAERAVALSPDLAEAYVALGYARMVEGRFDEAIDSFNRAIELNPNNWEAINDLGIIYLQTGRIAQAIRNWKRALKGDPGSAHGRRFNLALSYRILGLLERAEKANRSSLALEPDFILAIVNQAHVDLFQGDVAAATEAVEQLARDHDSNPYALMSAGWIFILAGEPERAREPLERAYEISPTAYGEGYVRVRLAYTL